MIMATFFQKLALMQMAHSDSARFDYSVFLTKNNFTLFYVKATKLDNENLGKSIKFDPGFQKRKRWAQNIQIHTTGLKSQRYWRTKRVKINFWEYQHIRSKFKLGGPVKQYII